MADDYVITSAGQYFERVGSLLIEAAPGPVDVVLCRRLADFPRGLPPGGALTTCSTCQAPIVFGPTEPHPDAPKRCLQCGGITPLPFPEGGP